MAATYVAITEQYREQTLSHYVSASGLVTQMPRKEKKKLVLLAEFVKQIEPGRQYTEAELNQLLQKMFVAHVDVRRYLVEYGYLKRTRDGSAYWLAGQKEQENS